MRIPRRTAVILIAASGVAAALFILKINKDMVDFNVNYAAGDRLIHGETLYRTSDKHYQFKYAPFCAMIYAPLALLSPTAARAIWYVLVLAATAGSLCLTARLLAPADEQGGRSARNAVLLAGLVLAKFFLREIQLGQINTIITFLLLLMVFNIVRDEAKRSSGRGAAAGFLWGLATAMKPYALIFLPYFILRRRWNILWPALLVLGLSLIAPSAYYGFPGNLAVHMEWISTLSRSTSILLDSQDNVSLLAMLTKWTHDPGFAQLGFAVFLLALVIVVYLFVRWSRGRPNAVVPETALLLLLIPLISPLGWDYTFLASVLAVALVLQHIQELPKIVRFGLILNLAVIGLSLYDLLGRRAYAAFMSASVLTLNFLIIVGVMVCLRWTRRI
ncbi:MAG: glycosyltransferase family 87 protein [Candidatus Aminicenantes bacterium]|nr:glycosyltransferase family 87 protein [Candidatus Aminicenantes bacterium]